MAVNSYRYSPEAINAKASSKAEIARAHSIFSVEI